RDDDQDGDDDGDGGGKKGPGRNGAGIKMFQKSVGNGATIVASFTRATSCRVSGGTFTATARSRGYTLTVRIPGFNGYRTYPLPFNAGGAPCRVTGRHGPFSNVYFPGGTPPPNGGAVTFPGGSGSFGLGFINAWNKTGSDSVALGGGATCPPPPRPQRR